jgi:hypothetical protein
MWIAHLKIPLPNWPDASAVSIEVAEQVDEQECRPEAEDDHRRARQRPVAMSQPLERPYDQEEQRQDVRRRPCGDVPVHLLEVTQDRGQEEEARDPHAKL